MDFKQALSIKGKITYAEGQLYGRVAARACRLLSYWARSGESRPLTPELYRSLSSVMRALKEAGPRIIRFNFGERPILIFTDGACEIGCTSVGAIIFEEGRRPQAFGVKMADWVIREWATKED